MARWVAFFLCCVGLLPSYVAAYDRFPVPGSVFSAITPAVGEFDGDEGNGLETAVVSQDGILSVVKADGVLLWSTTIPAAECRFTDSSDRAYTSVVAGDLFGDGVQHLVVGYGGFRGRPCDGGIAAYRARDGHRRWTFSMKKWALRKKFFAFRHAVYGTPALADVDRDGKLEIGFGGLDRNIYLLNANGSVRWFYNAADTVLSSPTFADLDRDGRVEMVIGTDISSNPRLKPPTHDGGYVYALDASIRVPLGTAFGFRNSKLQKWRAEFDQVIQASPVVADLLPKSPGLEVVTGSGCFFPQGGGARRGKWYKVLSAKSGRVLRTLKTSACTPSAAGIGDLDGDGVKEVVVALSGAQSAGSTGVSRVVAWSPARNQVLWSAEPGIPSRRDLLLGGYRRQPVVRDLDGDGRQEVLIAYYNSVVILDGASGVQLTCARSPCDKPLLRSGRLLQGAVAVADTDRNGLLEVLVAGYGGEALGILRWENPLLGE